MQYYNYTTNQKEIILMKKYEIWSEGFVVMEGRGKAQLHGYAEGNTFKEACINYAKSDKEFDFYFDPNRMTYWGCKLFDNEADARVSFG